MAHRGPAQRARQHPRPVLHYDLLRVRGELPARHGGRQRRRQVPRGLQLRPRQPRNGRTSTSRLTSNPSHLEAVDPVVEGRVRAKQAAERATATSAKVLPCSFTATLPSSGQGLVAETLNLVPARGVPAPAAPCTSSSTTRSASRPTPRFARSSPYPSDIAKMIEAPIFHVNGDDPEAVVHVAKIAAEFRQRFQKPVVIDMVCYRRFGHNEADEPRFTQPLLYKKINERPSVRALLRGSLRECGSLTEADGLRRRFR